MTLRKVVVKLARHTASCCHICSISEYHAQDNSSAFPTCVVSLLAISTFQLPSAPEFAHTIAGNAIVWDSMDSNCATGTPMCRHSSPLLCAWVKRKCIFIARKSYSTTDTYRSVRHRGPDWSLCITELN